MAKEEEQELGNVKESLENLDTRERSKSEERVGEERGVGCKFNSWGQ